MSDLTPSVPSEPPRITVEQYFGLVEAGVLTEDDRVELLEGVIVSMTPSGPAHATAVAKVTRALLSVVGDRVSVRPQLTFVAGAYSAPEPDLAVVPGRDSDYEDAHPRTALLAVEVALSSLAQDRLTKARIYARAGVAEYWIVNLRERVVEVMSEPDPARALYLSVRRCTGDDRIILVGVPGAIVRAGDLLPQPSGG
jgi:Uma2 family endonuclease